MLQKAQQKEWRRSLAHVLRQKVQEHCEEGIPNKACLLELGWYTKEIMVLYLVCERCGKQGCYVEENRRQEVISRRQLEAMKWCGCLKVVEKKMACSTEGKAQQSSTWPEKPEGAAKEEGSQREVRRTFQMLREV